MEIKKNERIKKKDLSNFIKNDNNEIYELLENLSKNMVLILLKKICFSLNL